MFIVLLLASGDCFASEDSEKPNTRLFNPLMSVVDDGRRIYNYVFYITPEHRRKSINYAENKLKEEAEESESEEEIETEIHTRAWDNYDNFSILATSIAVAKAGVLTRKDLKEEVKSISLLSDKDEIICEP